MKFLFDTNAVAALLKSNPIFRDRMVGHDMTEIAIPVIVMHEIAFGAYKSSKTEQHLRNFENLGLSKVDFTEEDALCSGKIRAYLAARGTPIGAYDTLIAAQALTRDLILVTHNTREFARVPGLKLEDWEL